MTFRVAGLTNPSIIVPEGARVTVEFINADSDEAHGWLVTNERPPFSFGQPKAPSIPGAFAGLIGDPTGSGDGASTITFRAGPAGTYQYICPMPGHAQMGMHGAFIVRHADFRPSVLNRAHLVLPGASAGGPLQGGRPCEREVLMRLGMVVLIVWLVVGAIAAGQRHYYTESSESCAGAGTVTVTILAGPLNYVGANPKVSCHVPQPSR